MKLFLVLLGVLAVFELSAKELFTKETILLYLTKENPFIYAASGKEYIYREKEKYYLGDFDTKISASYDKKEYPLSVGEFLNVTVEKPIENGIEFIAGYREAAGIQEYNNIKTGDEGEARAGMKVPVFSVIKDINTRKLNLYSASIDSVKLGFESQDNLRLLYFQIFSSYHKLIYFQSLLKLEDELVRIAQERERIIQKKVLSGMVPEISLLEAQQQIINRKQRFLSARNDFFNAMESFLQYLNISSDTFHEHYTLPGSLERYNNLPDLQNAIDTALKNRPDLKVFEYEIKKMDLHEQHASLLKYPNLNVGLYGVHDFKYGSGFKVAFDMDFPIEQRKYEGKTNEIKMSVKNTQNSKDKEIITIKTKLANSINSLKTIARNIQTADEELMLVQQLEEVENKKYNLGQSNLFMVNQREMQTLEMKKKVLKYMLDSLLISEEINKELAEVTL